MGKVRDTVAGRDQETTNGSDNTPTIISHGAVVKGRIEGKGEIIIHGSFEGEIISSASLMVAPTGVVDATIKSDRIYINGHVRGALYTEAVHSDSQAQFVGEVYTPSLKISEGAVLRGSCSMPDNVIESARKVISLKQSGLGSDGDPGLAVKRVCNFSCVSAFGVPL